MPQASSVSEIVCLLAGELGLRLRRPRPPALYAGISFDTGHFRHASTGPVTFRCAAALVEAGARPAALYAELYERRTLADARLWALAVQHARVVAGGHALVSVLTRADLAASGAAEDGSEGVVEDLRALRGVRWPPSSRNRTTAAHARQPALERVGRERPGRRARRRRPSPGGGVLQRRRSGGGGGVAEFRARRAPLDGVLLIDKPAGLTSHDVVARCAARCGRS